MAAGYTKEFLMEVYLSRYADILAKGTKEQADMYVQMCSDFYDRVGKDKFRVYASLDAAAIKEYKNKC